ncbi:MAG: CDGSH iron-sulfur domain-containing protein [Actinomycetota bacterium]|nr:CDGSH iron-sulfur domain-containing protein [Actinomycetota bacterium]
MKDPMVVVDPQGNRFPAERETIALCRRGGSTSKPFCDGTHSKVGFRAAERAVREEVWQER